MQKKLVIKSKFADMAGVNASTVTRISKTILKEAVEGKYIDSGHPAAIKYLENKELAQTNSTHDGVDPLYEKAVLICNQESCYKKSFIQRHESALKFICLASDQYKGLLYISIFAPF